MKKAEVIAAIAAGSGISKAKATKVLEVCLSTVARELQKTGKQGFVGFGTFTVVKRKARTGINPQTKKPIKIPAKKVVKFRPGKALSGGTSSTGPRKES